MTLYFSDLLRDYLNDAIEAYIGTACRLKGYSGTVPTNETTALGAQVVLFDITCPSDWMAASSGGVKSLSGTWSDATADAGGTCSFFRIYKSDNTTCAMQGAVSTSGAELNLTTTTIVSGQPVSVTQFDLTAPG
jgi:hypothetical protein